VVAGRQSLALIQVERELNIYHLDESLPGDLVLAEILRNQVKLRHPDGTLSTLMLTEDEADNARRPRVATTNAAPSGDEIRQVDENSWLVSRETVEKTRENLAEELRLAQMQPRVVNGQTDGFLVRMIKRQSILNKLGLRRGDVVMSINNIELNSPEKALQIFQQLREARQIDVAIERRGEPMNFSYQLN
jgi:general secretion pathway protein C